MCQLGFEAIFSSLAAKNSTPARLSEKKEEEIERPQRQGPPPRLFSLALARSDSLSLSL